MVDQTPENFMQNDEGTFVDSLSIKEAISEGLNINKLNGHYPFYIKKCRIFTEGLQNTSIPDEFKQKIINRYGKYEGIYYDKNAIRSLANIDHVISDHETGNFGASAADLENITFREINGKLTAFADVVINSPHIAGIILQDLKKGRSIGFSPSMDGELDFRKNYAYANIKSAIDLAILTNPADTTTYLNRMMFNNINSNEETKMEKEDIEKSASVIGSTISTTMKNEFAEERKLEQDERDKEALANSKKLNAQNEERIKELEGQIEKLNMELEELRKLKSEKAEEPEEVTEEKDEGDLQNQLKEKTDALKLKEKEVADLNNEIEKLKKTDEKKEITDLDNEKIKTLIEKEKEGSILINEESRKQFLNRVASGEISGIDAVIENQMSLIDTITSVIERNTQLPSGDQGNRVSDKPNEEAKYDYVDRQLLELHKSLGGAM